MSDSGSRLVVVQLCKFALRMYRPCVHMMTWIQPSPSCLVMTRISFLKWLGLSVDGFDCLKPSITSWIRLLLRYNTCTHDTYEIVCTIWLCVQYGLWHYYVLYDWPYHHDYYYHVLSIRDMVCYTSISYELLYRVWYISRHKFISNVISCQSGHTTRISDLVYSLHMAL
jgi:hypothetical protein